MADGRSTKKAAATDLTRSGVDSRVPRERHKNRVDSCAVGGWCLCSCSISSSTTTTTTTLPRPLPRAAQAQQQKQSLLPTPPSALSSTSTAHRRRIIGDASDDRRRDGVGCRCCFAVGDGSRHNDNNENNESCDVASANIAAESATTTKKEEVEENREVVGEEEGVNANGVVAAAAASEAVVAATWTAATVVSRLEPAASEDPLRSGESVSNVVVAAGLVVDDAASEVRSRTNKTRRGTSGNSGSSFAALYGQPKDKYPRARLDDTVNEVLVVCGRAAAAAASLPVSGANGERNSEHESVDNETRRRKHQQQRHKQQCYDDNYDNNNDKVCECRGYVYESDRRRPTTRNSVLLVERCIINNNNSSSRNTSAGGSFGEGVRGGVVGVSVRDSDSDDKLRILSWNFGYERSTSGSSVSEEKDGPDDDYEEDSVLLNDKRAMQSETTSTTTTTTSASRKEEMAEREIDDGVVVARLGSPFEGQIRTVEDTLVGPCGKKRCADRYDSSESSDSGVAVSCGDCSSSGTSDITEPGSPCSTSSDEGVAIRVTASSPLPSLLKLAPTTPPLHSGTRPQWPWTPPLAATACSTYKRLKVEPEAGTLPKAGAADPTARSGAAGGGKQQAASGKNNHHHHHESQGKITEYFKAQIKPQQPKLKKSLTDMSLLVAKSSPEFRRPPTVQRNKGGLAKYLGVVLPNGRSSHEREARTMTISPPPKKQSALTPRAAASKMDKKLCSKVLPSLPISSDVLAAIPSCKISSLRLTGEASPKPSGASPPVTPTASLLGEPVTIDFEDVSPTKPTVNENNNLTNGCANVRQIATGQEHPLTRLSSGLFDMRDRKEEPAVSRADEDDEDEEEEEDSTSGQSKATSSPILSAPTTIRFPARAPEKKGPRGTDSGICRWDKCDGRFECSGALLEHLQAAHINTQQGGDNFVCHWQGCKVQGRTSCSRRWLERHVLSHGGNKPFRCIVDGCGSRFSSQTALERHVNSHFNQPETSSSSGRRSCESGGKLVRRNGKKLRYRRQPWSGKESPKPTMPARKKRKRNKVRTSMISVGTARLFDYIDTGVMEGLQHRLIELAKTRTQGHLAETPGNSMTLTSQVLARRVELDGKAKVLLRWYPRDIEPDEWVLESEVQSTKHIGIRSAATNSIDEVSLVLYPAVNGGSPPQTRTKQRRKPVKNS